MYRVWGLILVLAMGPESYSVEPSEAPPLPVGEFQQEIHRGFTAADGLPPTEQRQLTLDTDGNVLVQTAAGGYGFDGRRWALRPDATPVGEEELSTESLSTLAPFGVDTPNIRGVAKENGEVAVAAANGLFLGDGTTWQLALPQQGNIRWAPVDVRAVTYDGQGRLWFACPQGVGYREGPNAWKLFTGADGLPYNDFTGMAAGPDGVWLGTSNGAIHYTGGQWEFRQGRRWLLDDHVRDLVVTADGSAWFDTAQGISRIGYQRTSLAEKAAIFEAEIDQYHRRTRFEFVSDATMTIPGDVSTAKAHATDNDGHFTGIYLGSASLGYAATKDPTQKAKAHKAFEALAFLSKVTEGGSHPAPVGFIARAVRETDGPDPNETLNPATDRERQKRDTLWKVMDPRWPIDETGDWYWKCDSSSDELDGYYFGFALYFDHVCETESERERLRVVVRRMTDHLLAHDLNMVDHDGQPTRWGHFSPKDLNQNAAWWIERGLNSQSILTYLSVAAHITGDPKYRSAYLELIEEHGYAMNVMTTPKIQFGPGSLGQADDNMAILNFYHLIRYETDPEILSFYYNAIFWYAHNEKYERNPFYAFVYAACCAGKTRTDQWRTRDLNPPITWMTDAVDTLKRYPMDRIDWPMSNAHRIDRVLLGDHTRSPGTPVTGAGHRNDGFVYPIDENHAIYWGDDPWTLERNSDATRLRDPVSYLVAYYMGVVHGFIEK